MRACTFLMACVPAGWMVKMRVANPEQLSAFMTADAYKAFLETSSD